MSEERKMILRMLAEGKISAEEAEQLFEALDLSTAVQDTSGTGDADPEAAGDAAADSEAAGSATAGSDSAQSREKEKKRAEWRQASFDTDALAETIRDAVMDGLKGMKEGLNAGLGVVNDGVLRGLHEGLRGGLRGLAATRRAGAHWHNGLGFGFFAGGPSREIDITQSIDAQGVTTIAISTASGDIRVQSWDEPGIKVRARESVRGRTDAEADERSRNRVIEWRRDGDRLTLFTGFGGEEPPESWSGSTDYDVYVPAACGVDLHTKSGDIAIAGITGAISAQSLSGDIRLMGVASAAVNVKSMSGDVNVRGGARDTEDLVARSVSGDVYLELEGMTGGNCELVTTSGDIVVRFNGTPDLRATLSTVSGDLRVDLDGVRLSQKSRWQLVAEVGTGAAKLTAKTTSGDISLRDD